ncbi:hypothetical protein VNO77_11263 [Canavalia gladiata]|uniref:Uncharacterized protein n=1 Tax=Canavalia gladiata TaxID=3824 RepID=A0AAN9R2K5_CANGL
MLPNSTEKHTRARRKIVACNMQSTILVLPIHTFKYFQLSRPSSYFLNIMANSKLVFMVSSILLTIIIFHGTFSALGRPLDLDNKSQVTTTYENSIKEITRVAENTVMWRRHILEFKSATAPESGNSQNDGDGKTIVDDFRPTDPGHSPGAGHSSPHTNEVPNP